MDYFGTKFKISKKCSRTNFKVSSKKGNEISLYTHFQKIITIKKNYRKKKTYILIPMIPYTLLYQKGASNKFVLEIFLIPMIPLYFIISKKNKK